MRRKIQFRIKNILIDVFLFSVNLDRQLYEITKQNKTSHQNNSVPFVIVLKEQQLIQFIRKTFLFLPVFS